MIRIASKNLIILYCLERLFIEKFDNDNYNSINKRLSYNKFIRQFLMSSQIAKTPFIFQKVYVLSMKNEKNIFAK